MGININESMDFLISIIIERIDKIKGDKDINPLEKSRKNIILEKKNKDDNDNNNDCC